MSRYRVVFGFQQSIFSPSEVYVSPDVSESAAGPVIQRLINARNQLVFTTDKWLGVRISRLDDTSLKANRRGRLYRPGRYSLEGSGIELTVPSNGTYSNTFVYKSDQARACLGIKVSYNNGRVANRYFSLVPDDVLSNPEFVSIGISGDPAWYSRFSSWQNEIINSAWAVIGKRYDGNYGYVSIRKWVQSSAQPTNLGISVDAADGGRFSLGQFLHITGARRKGTDKLSYNGRFLVDSIVTGPPGGQTIIYLAGTEAGDPASVKLPGTAQLIGYQAYAINTFSPAFVGVHKRGNAFGRVPGRRSSRATIDP